MKINSLKYTLFYSVYFLHLVKIHSQRLIAKKTLNFGKPGSLIVYSAITLLIYRTILVAWLMLLTKKTFSGLFTTLIPQLACPFDYILLNLKTTHPSSINKVHVRLRRIFNYVELNFQENINIRKAAEFAHLTVPAFCNYFKRLMNMTFTYFINQYRIEQAGVMLQQEISISTVCFNCGFNNVPYFNKVFKNITGKTPSEYKKKQVD